MLKASWFAFEDPEKWFELPQDAIVVIDEAQGWFGARDPRARPPEHITRFETMRHQGHEVHLVTQDPRYLDVHLRRLCNGHIHYWRVFKSQQLLRFESEAVIEKVEVKSSFKDADKKTLRLDSKYFGAYTSTNAKHHFQTQVPTKFLLALGVIVAAAFLIYRAYERYEQGQLEAQAATEASAPLADKGMVDQVKSTVGSFINPAAGQAEKGPLTTAQYLAARTPRIPDIPSSAPIYDELTEPKTYPRLSCMLSSDESYIERNSRRYRVIEAGERAFICECFTQQGTWHKTTFSFCKNMVEHGAFDPAKPDPEPPPRMADKAVQPPAQQPIPKTELAPEGIAISGILEPQREAN